MIFIDQLNREVNISASPQRIISVVPSQSELLYDLGLKDRLVGQTIFCVHPENEFKAATKIGGTKKLDIPKIIALKPDLIIANKEENDKEQIEELEKHFPVWISDVNTFDESLYMIRSIGEITQTLIKANHICNEIILNRNVFLEQTFLKRKVIYLIWNNPFIAVGTNTFINSMLTEAVFENGITKSRYPEITLEEIKEINPDLLLLSSEPFPFKYKHRTEINKQLGTKKCVLVDGEMFSWYGSRMIKAYEYFKKLRKALPS